jgi:hypothetical protein
MKPSPLGRTAPTREITSSRGSSAVRLSLELCEPHEHRPESFRQRVAVVLEEPLTESLDSPRYRLASPHVGAECDGVCSSTVWRGSRTLVGGRRCLVWPDRRPRSHRLPTESINVSGKRIRGDEPTPADRDGRDLTGREQLVEQAPADTEHAGSLGDVEKNRTHVRSMGFFRHLAPSGASLRRASNRVLGRSPLRVFGRDGKARRRGVRDDGRTDVAWGGWSGISAGNTLTPYRRGI